MKTKKFLYDKELTHSFTKMNGIKIIDSFAKMFCPHTNWQNATTAGRTNSRTNCQQNRIAISRSLVNAQKCWCGVNEGNWQCCGNSSVEPKIR
jgi:hypothetical protein